MRPLFLLLVLILVSGWNWQTHPAFAESIYYTLPDPSRAVFDLEAMKNGSIAPDRDFHDNRNHHYPPSYNLTLYWLKKAKDSYILGDYEDASYAFGVASHYISDSYAAPHNVERESSSLHSEYERQGSTQYLFIPCPLHQDLDLNASLQAATKTGSTWKSWVATKDPSYSEQAVADAMTTLYHVFFQTFNITCDPQAQETTHLRADYLPTHWLTITLIGVVLYFFCSTFYSLCKEE